MMVGRFQVMAMLQAARANELGFSLRRAKSWGLNRTIFYAAAKRGFKHAAGKPVGRGRSAKGRVVRVGKSYFLGNEMAYTSRKGNRTYFTIGGEAQTEADFKRNIEARFGNAFTLAWKESLDVVRQYPKDVLLSQNVFSAKSIVRVETN
jgi:hypothetical protein